MKVQVLKGELDEIQKILHKSFNNNLYFKKSQIVRTISALEQANRELAALDNF